MSFQGLQRTFHYVQTNHGPIEEVFPLLCPVREADWLDGWTYRMIHSQSGFIEKDCVFTTPHHGEMETVWQVTQYDTSNFTIEFLRVTPMENVVRIGIQLEPMANQQTRALIDYQYTALNEEQNRFIESELENTFQESMLWWEKAINYYLETGEMLRKSGAN